jgi:hypothetical protein
MVNYKHTTVMGVREARKGPMIGEGWIDSLVVLVYVPILV